MDYQYRKFILGEYTDEQGKTKITCACRDVRNPGEIMHPVQTINLSSLDDLATNEASLKNAMDFAEHLHLIPAETVKSFYYDMLVADALLGNTDRHNGNWAILTDEKGNARLSPIYGCGSSLSPLLGETDLDDRHLSNSAIDTFSIILDEHHKRLNYRDYFLSCKDPELNAAAKRLIGRINLYEINNMINPLYF